MLDEILAKLNDLSEPDRKALAEMTSGPSWVPNPGPQTEAFFSEADEVFYGGQAGGGKTDLGVGLATTQHKRSLILRRINKDAVKLVPRIEEVLGSRDGYNGQLQRWKLTDKQIDIAGCEQENDKQRFKGDPHDLIVFDEGTDFLESQYRFIIGWNRSADPAQRCRVLVTSNPPTTSSGLWVIKYWGPWLDPQHPNPAKPGELRWFTTIDGEDTEVDGPGPHMIDGEPIMARSRTYIPAKLSDNPDLARTNYSSVLAGLPDELRRAYRDGDFSVGLRDDDFQVIPTAWIQAAQDRWTEQIPEGIAMTAMAVDVAPGGGDATVLAWRYGGWFAPVVSTKQEDRDGHLVAANVVRHRRDNCPVVVDVGGGWGGDAVVAMKDNGISVLPFNGVDVSNGTTRDGKLRFRNKRAAAIWTLREELDPTQEGGSAVKLPPDSELRADLASYTWKLTTAGILVESKEEIRKRLGRSPDKGDAVVMCLSEGNAAIRRERARNGTLQTTANMGHANIKRRRR